MVKAIVFDFDDTLYIGSVWGNWTKYLEDGFLEVTGSEDGLKNISQKYDLANNLSSKDAVEICVKENIEPKLMTRYYKNHIYMHTCVPQIINDKFLERLGKKLPIYIVSMSEKKYIDYYCDLYKINKSYFKKIYSVNLVAKTKSKKWLYKQVEKNEKIKPEEILVVGDNLNYDVKPAEELGMKTIHFRKDFNQIYDYFTENKILNCSEFKK